MHPREFASVERFPQRTLKNDLYFEVILNRWQSWVPGIQYVNTVGKNTIRFLKSIINTQKVNLYFPWVCLFQSHFYDTFQGCKSSWHPDTPLRWGGRVARKRAWRPMKVTWSCVFFCINPPKKGLKHRRLNNDGYEDQQFVSVQHQQNAKRLDLPPNPTVATTGNKGHYS